MRALSPSVAFLNTNVSRLANPLGTYPAIFSCWAEATHSDWKVLSYS